MQDIVDMLILGTSGGVIGVCLGKIFKKLEPYSAAMGGLLGMLLYGYFH